MNLKNAFRLHFPVADEISGLCGIDLYDRSAEFQPGNSLKLRKESEKRLAMARLFLTIDTDSSYSFSGPPKSELYTKEEIVEVLVRRGGFISEQAESTANEIIGRGYIEFYSASRGVSAVKIVPYHNKEGATKYRFEGEFCDA